MRGKIIIVLTLLGIPTIIGMYNWSRFQGKFIINQSKFKDEINFESGGKFTRVYSLNDSIITENGYWNYKNNHIYLTDWSNRNGLLRISSNEVTTVAFLCSRNWFMRPNAIYIDHTKEIYYCKIE